MAEHKLCTVHVAGWSRDHPGQTGRYVCLNRIFDAGAVCEKCGVANGIFSLTPDEE